MSAPSKAFNIAGLFSSYIICPDDAMRKRIIQVQNKHHVLPTPFANTAIIAAYTDSRAERWLDQLTAELEEQATYLVERLQEELPQLKTFMPEASYLLWIDFAGLGLEPEARKKWLHEQVRLFLSPGLPFGASGTTFERLNFGTARPVLDEALKRLTEHAAGKAFV
ncbi:aminotransferase class I/II-fold pyridoxal phosphate-dependent enzyme [Exiguobacterium sp. AM39-5BH]|uniref:aminotransferase class I/II-fold pyridoxal phosphate-dependent enzyme n=1 Tax=Exiguobacterium sp. AM39-5BH TaxID=2292355 RepID=UPI002101D058|nr:aminotransferase class I/II-fold pyridoxal phosphate-dependent enzyme [Exiguobacterium sp. AM39-5BH]